MRCTRCVRPCLPLLLALGLGACRPTQPEPPSPTPDVPAVDADAWDFDATEAEIGVHLGRSAIRLRGGFAFAKDLELQDGVLEFDMASERGIAFAGVVWHVLDEGNYEKMYLRPFLSGSREATQYTPVANHTAGWQLYHGPGYNQPVDFDRRAWLPVKVVVSGDRVELYVRDMGTPKLTAKQRAPQTTGRVGLIVERIPEAMGPAAVWFSNVRFTPSEAPPIVGTAPDESDPGRVPAWAISPTTAELPSDGSLPVLSGDWVAQPAEASGLVNLAFARPLTKEQDTALACATVQADSATRRRLRFGFSEHARVWLNGVPLFDGDEAWHERDITFQGIVGYWYALWTSLEAGDNELCFGVTENVQMRGGWGFRAAFDDVSGLRFATPRATITR
jgi:hypothetical protein